MLELFMAIPPPQKKKFESQLISSYTAKFFSFFVTYLYSIKIFILQQCFSVMCRRVFISVTKVTLYSISSSFLKRVPV